MKTVLQELFDNHIYKKSFDDSYMINLSQQEATELLEKEKEQIIYDYNNGVNDGNTQGLEGKEGNGNYATLEEYYNQTYNQNK